MTELSFFRKRVGVIEHPSDARASLIKDGFAVLNGNDFSMGEDLELAVQALGESFDDLPVDPNDPSGLRFRRYGRFILTPWAGSLSPVPTVKLPNGDDCVKYYQPSSLNSVDGGESRAFVPLHPGTQTNKALIGLIWYDFEALPLPPSWHGLPILVGVHQIRLRPETGRPSVSSPDHCHRDGEPFTWVHLLNRENVTGGENYVATPESAGTHPSQLSTENIFANFTLTCRLDSFVVDDLRVSHHVNAVACVKEMGVAPSCRDVFLIDFTPMAPQFV